MNKVIIRKYRDEDKWEEVSLEEALDRLEGAGYWKPGTVKQMLEEGVIVWNPSADYKMVDKDVQT